MSKLWTALLAIWLTGTAYPQSNGEVRNNMEHIVTFRFVAGVNMFFNPWKGNEAELNRLYALVEQYRAEITSYQIPVYVDGYSATKNLSFIRSNRVKSELITRKGLQEDHFITRNYAGAYIAPDGKKHRDMVVVTLRIPVKAEEPQPEPQPEPCPEHQPGSSLEPQPECQPHSVLNQEPELIATDDPLPSNRFLDMFTIRTNLLYDAFLLPTLGVEWRINPSVGVKLDGSRSWWGTKRGKVQRIWLLNPEARWYLGKHKRLYTGVSGSFGEYNVYKGMIGTFFPDDTGYQGKLWGAGITAGYQLPLNRFLALDFNLGFGYTHVEYDSFHVINQTRVYIEKDKTGKYWSPTQAGVSLVWSFK